jgi:hypothetical protein
MAWTDPNGFTWAVGEVLTASDMNLYIAYNMISLAYPPMLSVILFTATNTVATTATQLPFDQVLIDNGGGYSQSNYNYTVTVAGLYSVTSSFGVNDTTSGDSGYAEIYHAGIEHVQGSSVTGDGTMKPCASAYDQIQCAVGDVIAGYYYWTTASKALLTGNTPAYTYMQLVKVSN